MREPRLELGPRAWEARILPLNYSRSLKVVVCTHQSQKQQCICIYQYACLILRSKTCLPVHSATLNRTPPINHISMLPVSVAPLPSSSLARLAGSCQVLQYKVPSSVCLQQCCASVDELPFQLVVIDFCLLLCSECPTLDLVLLLMTFCPGLHSVAVMFRLG